MKAAQISDYGGLSTIKINEVPIPVVGKGQVLVKIFAASLNPFDSKLREGQMKETIPLNFPATLGGDIAGVVEKAGETVTALKAGDRVYGQASTVAGNSGAFAEYCVTSAQQVSPSPANLSHEQAASLPLVGVSALQALFQHLELLSGQRIFIHGGAGGIGSIAVQVAKNVGAFVATTATGEAKSLVKKLGADEIIDYRSSDFSTMLSGFDAAFDTVGGNDFDKCLQILKPGGKAVSMTAKADELMASDLGVTAVTQNTKITNAMLEKLTQLAESGAITPCIAKIFPLNDARDAFAARENGALSGKIVLKMR